VEGVEKGAMQIYSLSLPKTNLTFKWCILLTQTRKWRPSIGGITKSTFSARKEMLLLMSYNRYMIGNNVVGAGVRYSGGSPTSTLGGSGLISHHS
jgi:hypothetical protein